MKRHMSCCRLHQHNKSFNALHMHTFQSQTFRIVSKGNQCLCQEYFAMHTSHSSCHSSKYGRLYHNMLKSKTIVTLVTLMGLAVGVEYAQKCLYNFFHYRTQSIILQASPFQTNRARTTLPLSTVRTKAFS